MGKIACFFGLHNWERSTEVYHGQAPGMYYGEFRRVPAQTWIEKCKTCGEERGIIDAGSHSEVFPASYIRNQMRQYDAENERHRGIRIPSLSDKFKHIQEWQASRPSDVLRNPKIKPMCEIGRKGK